jgi:Tol biopolymer transport system component
VETPGGYPGGGGPVIPPTGNAWPSGSGKYTAYANAGTGEVYIRDGYLRTMVNPFTQGSEPAMAPDGEEVVFVRSVSGVDHVFEESLTTKTATDLTPGLTADATEPTWSPDGRTVAFRTSAGIDTVSVGGGQPVQVSGYTGLPAYRA